MARKRHIGEGDTVELRVSEKVGWVEAVCSYASRDGSSFVLDTKEHGRFPMSDSEHEDIRTAKGKR